MRLLAITDVHSEQDAMRRILAAAGKVDLILLGGDLTSFGTVREAMWFVDAARAAAPRVFAVAGNCDSPPIDQRLAELDVTLFGRGRVVEGVGFLGLSAMPRWHGATYELTEDDLAAALDAGASELPAGLRQTVVLSHPPPRYTTTDRTMADEHVGSKALRNFIEAHQPTLVLCGHIHEARGIDRVGATTVVNCGPAFVGHYALVDLDDEVLVSLRTA